MKGASTVIPAQTSISGRLEGAEDVAVYGALSGTVQLDGDLFVDQGGTVQADLSVNALTIEGILVGDVTASGTVELTSTAQVIGDIRAPQVIVADGARFRGLIDMGDAASEGGTTRRTARAAAPARSARPAPRPARRPEPTPAPAAQAPEPEPELPKSAGGKKKVAVKKRK